MKQVFIAATVLILLSPVGASHVSDGGDLLLTDGFYRLEVVAFEFGYNLTDLNAMDSFLDQGMNATEARLHAKMDRTIQGLEPGRAIQIVAKSVDSRHGLLIDELNIEFTLDPPAVGDEFGPVRSKLSDLPSVDTTIRAYCNIYCGVGHDQMSFELEVGEGFEYQNGQIDVLGDWRVWVLFGMFGSAVAVIILLSVAKPRWVFRRDDYE